MALGLSDLRCADWNRGRGRRIKPTAAVHQDANSTLIRSSNTIRLSQNITVYTCQAVILYEVKADLNPATYAATW